MTKDESLTGNVVADRVAFTCPWLSVREAVVRHGTGQANWYYLDHPGCALVLPITTNGDIVLIRAWRVAVRQWCWEAPAGRIDHAERPTDAARRELLEEIGGTAAEMLELGSVFASSGSSNERIHLFVGQAVTLGDSQPDPDEIITRELMTPGQALGLARSGRIEDAPTALAILWAHDRRLLC